MVAGAFRSCSSRRDAVTTTMSSTAASGADAGGGLCAVEEADGWALAGHAVATKKTTRRSVRMST